MKSDRDSSSRVNQQRGQGKPPALTPDSGVLRVLARDFQLPLPDDHLVQLGQSLFALVTLEFGPILEVDVEDG